MRRSTTPVLLAIPLVLGLELGTTHAQTPRPRPPSPLERLDLLFGTTGDTATSPEGRPVAEQVRLYRSFMRSRMEQDAFYEAVVPRLFSILSDGPFHILRSLKRIQGARAAYYHYPDDSYYGHSEPCAQEETVLVAPWWDPRRPVRICTDSYRPAVVADARSGSRQYCDAWERGSPDERPVCGCGPHLLNCAPEELRPLTTRAVYEEFIRTVQWVIQSRRPFSDIVTMNGSVRSDWGEVFYARNRFFLTGKLDLRPGDHPARPSLRPRDAHFAGGILTMPYVRYFDEAGRVILAKLWEDLLCTPFASTSVETDDLLQLGDSHLRSKDHMELASRDGCKSCHARLENGMRAFRGFLSRRDGIRFDPALRFHGTIQFYVRDADDLRAEGPATPLFIGEAIARQPEFTSCMVRKSEELVYGGYAVPRRVHAYLGERFARDREFGRLLEDTVILRFVGERALEVLEAEARRR